MIFWLVLKLEISYRFMISWGVLVSFRGFFEDYIFAWPNIWVSIILLLLEDTFQCKWQGHSVTHPLLCFVSKIKQIFSQMMILVLHQHIAPSRHLQQILFFSCVQVACLHMKPQTKPWNFISGVKFWSSKLLSRTSLQSYSYSMPLH
jgi:hypothetical protein